VKGKNNRGRKCEIMKERERHGDRGHERKGTKIRHKRIQENEEENIESKSKKKAKLSL
jgi:hypothetical protein